ncbi:MAG: Ig domain-containing protein [Pedobacter sp.]
MKRFAVKDIGGMFLISLALLCGYPEGTHAADKGPQIYDLTYKPAAFHVGSGVEVVPRLLHGSDKNVRYDCRWFVDNEEVEGVNATSLSGEYFQRGDMVAVEVTAVQGGRRGGPVQSGAIEAHNAPPEIVSTPPEQLVQGVFEYRLETVDADEDDLLISLITAPEGMQLDADSGTLVWQVEPGTKGVFPVTVRVEDPYGGWASQEFELNLSYVKSKDEVHE